MNCEIIMFPILLQNKLETVADEEAAPKNKKYERYLIEAIYTDVSTFLTIILSQK